MIKWVRFTMKLATVKAHIRESVVKGNKGQQKQTVKFLNGMVRIIVLAIVAVITTIFGVLLTTQLQFVTPVILGSFCCFFLFFFDFLFLVFLCCPSIYCEIP